MLPRNRREKDLRVQIQHKWVYKTVLKLTPSTLSEKLLKKKKKASYKNLSSMECFHRSAACGPKRKLHSLCALASTSVNDPQYCGHPESQQQSCQLNMILFWPRGIIEKHFLSTSGKPSFNQYLFICMQWPDIRESSNRDEQRSSLPFFTPTTTQVTKYCPFSCAVITVPEGSTLNQFKKLT